MSQQEIDKIDESEEINVYGARVHNLRNIDVTIPRNQLVVITGLSGSGKSSLAFDTIYAEGQRRYIETFSAYARQFLGGMERPDVDKISGLSPVIAIEQKTTGKNPRSTVGTITEIYDFLRLLYARAGHAYSYASGELMVKYTDDQILKLILEHFQNRITSYNVCYTKLLRDLYLESPSKAILALNEAIYEALNNKAILIEDVITSYSIHYTKLYE